MPLKIGAISFKVTEGRRNEFSLHRYRDEKLGIGRSCTIAVKFFADTASTDAATLSNQDQRSRWPGGGAYHGDSGQQTILIFATFHAVNCLTFYYTS